MTKMDGKMTFFQFIL